MDTRLIWRMGLGRLKKDALASFSCFVTSRCVVNKCLNQLTSHTHIVFLPPPLPLLSISGRPYGDKHRGDSIDLVSFSFLVPFFFLCFFGVALVVSGFPFDSCGFVTMVRLVGSWWSHRGGGNSSELRTIRFFSFFLRPKDLKGGVLWFSLAVRVRVRGWKSNLFSSRMCARRDQSSERSVG